MTLEEFFRQHKKVALGYSGGVDSTFLLYMAKKYGVDLQAYYVKTAFQPDFELEDAKAAAKEIGMNFRVIDFDVLSDKTVVENPPNRCYFCKQRIFGKIAETAKKDGYSCIIDGTNASDDADDRPGMKALAELEVYSPLRLCGWTKEKIREELKKAGIFTWEKPAYACLATRIAGGQKITAWDLKRVERGESFLSSLGFKDFRIRLRGDSALIQVREKEIEKLLGLREKIEKRLNKDFSQVMLDLKAREEEKFFKQRQEDIDGGQVKKESILCLSATVDDMTGEEIAFVKERILEEGALDFYSISVDMKKGRPGFVLETWSKLEDEEKMIALLLKHTSSLGIRRQVVERYIMDRKISEKETKAGSVRIKAGSGLGICKEKAEYEDLAKLAKAQDKSLWEIREEIK
ncbi:MAG TPA: ATP-dependent sacrificial sulfur transferase LarE [Lachnospiraceae bacterium]